MKKKIHVNSALKISYSLLHVWMVGKVWDLLIILAPYS